MYNRALFGTYAPGSTFKVGVAIAALEEGIIEKDTIINAQGKYTYYSDYQPECWIYAYGGTHGYINVTEAIQESCNYFFYEVGRLLGKYRVIDEGVSPDDRVVAVGLQRAAPGTKVAPAEIKFEEGK